MFTDKHSLIFMFSNEIMSVNANVIFLEAPYKTNGSSVIVFSRYTVYRYDDK